LLARDARMPEDQRRNLQTIDRSGQHLLALINDVLEISRIESGRLEAQVEAIDLIPLLTPLGEVMALHARQKGLELRVELAPDLPRYVSTDAGKLRQILFNLLSNAVKYTERGTVTLSAGKAEGAAGRATLRFAVADTGVGMAAEDLRRICEPFYQTEYGARRGEGTGLGLTICQNYARLLGGTLDIESTPGQGSRFTLTLPVELSAAVETAAAEDVIGLAPSETTRRILVAEDDADSRRLLTVMLEQAGLQVLAVADGLQAVQAFETWRPDFVWMDMRMPVLDGYEATRRIRALPGGESVKIVALTASAFREDRDGIIAAGCDDVLTKPVAENRLFETMARLLGLHYRQAPHQAEKAIAENLAALPAALRQELTDTARLLDIEAVRVLIERIRPEYAEIAALLTELVDAYRLDKIIALCEAAGTPDA
jgi:CheY-like chemotaxis protein